MNGILEDLHNTPLMAEYKILCLLSTSALSNVAANSSKVPSILNSKQGSDNEHKRTNFTSS